MATKCVCIKYNGYFLVPAPMISVSRSFQDDGTGRVIGSTLNIKLEGKIVNARPGPLPGGGVQTRAQYLDSIKSSYSCLGSTTPNTDLVIGTSIDGINTMMEEERAFRKVFSNSKYNYTDADAVGTFNQPPNANIASDSNRLVVIANNNAVVDGFAKVVSYSSSPTSNNWVNTIDYSVELVIEEPATQFLNDSNKYLVSSVTDNFSIEPLDETNVFNNNDSIFSTYFGSSIGANSLWYNGAYPANATRYRITRTISAVGKHSHNEQALSSTESAPGALTTNDPVYDNILGDANRIPNALVTAGSGTAFTNARSYVLERLRHYPTIFYLNTWTLVNRVRTLSPNELGGSFEISETSIAVNPAYHPPWADDWSAEVSVDSSFLQTVRINGTVKGYETYTGNTLMDNPAYGAKAATMGNNSSVLHTGILQPILPTIGTMPSTTAPAQAGSIIGKYQNAVSGMHWLKGASTNSAGYPNTYLSPMARRAELFFTGGNNTNNIGNNPYRWLNSNTIMAERNASNSTYQMNPVPVSMSESHRSHAGEIDYTFEFNNRPLSMIRGSVSETLNINDNFPVQQIAEIFVLGRKLGPVLQDLNTVSAASREITLEVVLPRPRSLLDRTIFPVAAYQAATGIIEQLNPKYMFGTTDTTIKSFVKSDSQTWNPIEGRLSINKGWTWQRGK
jgi:hypothetical protein